MGFRPHGRPKGFPIALWKPSDASSLIWPLTHHPKPKGLGDFLCVDFSFESMFLCKVGFRPHGRPKGFPIALWKPSKSHLLFRVVTCLLEERFFLCCLLKIAGRGQAEGVQGKRTAQWAVAEGEFPKRSGGGPTGKPPGCCWKDKPNPSDYPKTKTPPEKRDVLNGENEKPNRITGKGSIVYDGYAVFYVI